MTRENESGERAGMLMKENRHAPNALPTFRLSGSQPNGQEKTSQAVIQIAPENKRGAPVKKNKADAPQTPPASGVTIRSAIVGWLCLNQKNNANRVAGCFWLAVPQPTEWQRIAD
jgi:hypothetical protein